MTRCLALDPASCSGYAFGTFGKRPTSNTIRLPPHTWRPIRLSILEGNIRDLIDANRPDVIAIEDIFAPPPNQFNMQNNIWMCSVRALIEVAAYKSGMQEQHVLVCPVGTWRKAFLGSNSVPDHVRKAKRSKQWLKDRVHERCLDLGWEPRNKDESDALGLWAWAEGLYEPAMGIERTPLFDSVKL